MVMHAKTYFLVPALTALFCLSVFGQEPAIMKTVRQLYGEKMPIETRFDLHILWKVREKEESKSGKIVLAPGDKFRVELGAATWVCDGRNYWEISRDENKVQVVIKRSSEIDRSAMPSRVVQTYLTNYTFRLKQTVGPLTVVTCAADSLSKIADIDRVDLSVDSKSGIIKTLLVVDKNGNESSYRFTKTKIPARPPASAFSYTAPKGASIIDLRN
jgi:outer membrane lipoprotein-sorting protein